MADRIALFDKLNGIVHNNRALCFQGIELLDASLSPLYLALLGLYNDQLHAGNKSVYNVSKLTERLKDKMTRISAGRKQAREIEKSAKNYRPAKYLFFPVEPTHLHQMIPVLAKMQSQRIDVLVITNRLLIYQRLKQSGFDPVLINYPAKDKGHTLNQLVDVLHINGFRSALIEQLGEQDAEQYFKVAKKIIEHYTIPFILQLSVLLSFVNPVAVVVGYDITLEGRILTLLGKQKGIRTVCLQHGSISGEPLDHYHIVDQFLVYGNAVKKYLVGHGMPAANCIVTGAPYLDEKSFGNKDNIQKLKTALSIANDAPFILIALSGPGHSTSLRHFNKVVKHILQVTVDYPGYRFVAKLHRKDKPDNYKDMVAQVPQHKLTIVENDQFSFDIFDWLKSCDLLITGTSTVAQEAMLLGVPVLTIDLMNEYHDVDFIDQGCTIHITDGNKIGAAVHTLITNKDAYAGIKENARRYAEDSFYKLDHNAAARCLDVIMTQNSTVDLV